MTEYVILNALNKASEYVLLALIVLIISMMRYKDARRKRFALILIALIFLSTYLLLFVVEALKLPFWGEYIPLLIAVIVIVILRKKLWPWRLHCSRCGKRLNFGTIFSRDLPLCDDCYYEEFPEEKKKAEEEARKKMGKNSNKEIEDRCIKANKIEEVPWGSWEYTEECVLTFVFDGEKVLMINKKTGMGSGYINAPGGHVELEESRKEAAIRETKEETGLDVKNLEEVGVLRFQFKDGTRMIGYVFTTSSFSGEMIDECEETKPFWINKSEIDYTAMWEDDRLWLPLLLDGKKFSGWFIFDDRTMIDSKITESIEMGDE